MARGDQAAHTVLATHATVADVIAQREELRSYVVVIENDEPIARHLLDAEPLTVGRDESRHIVIPDARVSRLHLQVFAANGAVVAEDLGSSNGTFYEGRRIAGPVVLPEGHFLQVGSRLLKHERRSRREVEREDELRRDLDKAGSYVRALLPAPIAHGPIRTDWFYRPSTQLGGDAFAYDLLDDDHVYACLIDVSGHGAGAAMHTVAVMNVLRRRALPDTDFRDPAAVLAGLNAMFQMDDHDGLYFTLWYGVYCVSQRRLSYGSAGHHPAYLYPPGGASVPLRTPGMMVGAMPGARFKAGSTDVPPGSALYLFSDGVFETTTPDGRQCGLDDFLPLLGRGPEGPGESEAIYRAVRQGARPGPLDDDFSLLVVRFA